ncbi:MAG: exopolysaccharide biosynthesis polyprenyl glycosylphosphotransferase [Terriglobia bacterium]
MIRRRLNYIGFFIRLEMLCLPLVAFAIAAWVRFGSGWIPLVTTDVDPSDYFGLLFFTTIVWSVVLDQSGLARFDILFAARSSAWAAFRACVVTYVAAMGATFFYRSASFSRVLVAISGALLFLLVLLSQRGARSALQRARCDGRNCARILVVGADDFAARAAGLLLRSVVPCAIAGFVRLPDQEIQVTGAVVVDLEALEGRVREEEIDDIIVAIPPGRLSELPTLLQRLDPLCVPVRAILDFGVGVTFRETLFDFGGLPMLDLRASPSESVIYLVAKRGLDVILASLGLLVLAPLMALIAVATRLSSPGPILFVQDRVGLNGRVFRMVKFRTMRTGDPAENDTRWTVPGDPRRTPLGRFLRRTNLDELPQLFNVLKGEMSLVGPRPERPFFVQKFLHDVAQYNSRHYLKVGITGWAQVNGFRGDTSIEGRVEHDLFYLRHWSLGFDLKIILLTLWRSFAGSKNAY